MQGGHPVWGPDAPGGSAWSVWGVAQHSILDPRQGELGALGL